MKVVTLCSGGLDSVVLAYLLKEKGFDQILLGFNYSQKHIRELLIARRVAQQLKADFIRINLKNLGRFFDTSCLTNDQLEIDLTENDELNIVPNRNAIMLSIAFAIAVNKNFDAVAIAVHPGSSHSYPDCTPKFLTAFEVMEKYSLGDSYNIWLITPFAGFSKSDIILQGISLGVPLEKTLSCYTGREMHCGKCHACVERRKAFVEAGITDPTEYEDDNSK